METNKQIEKEIRGYFKQKYNWDMTKTTIRELHNLYVI